MRGEVLHYDEVQGFGFINGEDANRYTFAHEDLRVRVPIAKGMQVSFDAESEKARRVSPLNVRPTGTVPQQPNFGRFAPALETESSSLWSYFWRGITANHVNFSGRARRKEYWAYCLFYLITLVALLVAGTVVEMVVNGPDTIPVIGPSLGGLFIVATLLPGAALAIRRQHDIGLSGWFYLLVLFASVGWIILFVFSLIPSQPHENRWGPVPGGIPSKDADMRPQA